MIKFTPNESVLCQEGIRIIKLTKGQFTVIDEADYESVRHYRWRAAIGKKTFYAIAHYKKGKKTVHIKMARLILKATNPNIPTDHIDRNGLNNRRYNLRICSHSENNYNRGTWAKSGFKGIYLRKDKWQATVLIKGKIKSIGYFKNQTAAFVAQQKVLEVNAMRARVVHRRKKGAI